VGGLGVADERTGTSVEIRLGFRTTALSADLLLLIWLR